ncbi:hypothetical protein RB600_005582 [Gaeumannomyces tritici]
MPSSPSPTLDVEKTLESLSLAEKASLLAGSDFWHTAALPRHGVPAIKCTDGPNDARGGRFFNPETAKMAPDVRVPERALREVYLRPFQIAVRDGKPGVVMSSYNKVNGVRVSESRLVLDLILGQEWGFEGLVMSDWVRHLLLRQEPQCRPRHGNSRPRPVGVHTIDERARKVLAFVRLATESVVLLKNSAGALPVDAAACADVAVIGPNAGLAAACGGGSASLQPHYTSSVLEGIRAHLRAANPAARVHHEPGVFGHVLLPPFIAGKTVAEVPIELFNEPHTVPSRRAFDSLLILDTTYQLMEYEHPRRGWQRLHVQGGGARRRRRRLAAAPPRPGGSLALDPDESIRRAAHLARRCGHVFVVAGLNAGLEKEGMDRASMSLPPCVDDLVAAVLDANPAAAIATQAGNPIAMPWRERAPAIVHSWYGGYEAGDTVADVLFGAANPSGRLPVTFLDRLEGGPAFLSVGSDNGSVMYAEDVFVGYRWFEARRIEPAFPFGHGLSYTTFRASDAEVALQVENTGSRSGAELVRLYVSFVTARPPGKLCFLRPLRTVAGFEKVFLAAGECKLATLPIRKDDISVWDERRQSWCCEAGEYSVSAVTGADSLALPL